MNQYEVDNSGLISGLNTYIINIWVTNGSLGIQE